MGEKFKGWLKEQLKGQDQDDALAELDDFIGEVSELAADVMDEVFGEGAGDDLR